MADPSTTSTPAGAEMNGQDKAQAGIRVRELPAEIRLPSWRQRLVSAVVHDKVKKSIRTLAWVLPLSFLIWVYAERAQVSTQPGLTLRIEIRTNAPNRVVSLGEAAESSIIEVNADISGSNANVGRIRNALASPIPLYLPDGAPTGQAFELRLAEALSRTPLMVNNGVSVAKSVPADVKVRVDRIVTRQIPVECDVRSLTESQAKALAKGQIKFEFEPAQVEVSGPQPVLENSDPKTRAVLLASLSGVSTDKAGTIRRDGVPIRFSGPSRDEPSRNVALLRQTVKAQITVVGEKAVLAEGVPLFAAMSAATADGYELVSATPKSVTTIHVVGTAEQIEMLKATSQPAVQRRAFLLIQSGDLKVANLNGEYTVTKRLTPDDLVLPFGVVADPDELLPEATAVLRKR